ncbi:MAG: hypothetical protein AB1467_03090 [Candidatus Diapherotrites archaeon]
MYLKRLFKPNKIKIALFIVLMLPMIVAGIEILLGVNFDVLPLIVFYVIVTAPGIAAYYALKIFFCGTGFYCTAARALGLFLIAFNAYLLACSYQIYWDFYQKYFKKYFDVEKHFKKFIEKKEKN